MKNKDIKYLTTGQSKERYTNTRKAKGFIPQSHRKKVTNFGQQKLPL
jgi:hypothetical protein